ncbi:MAG: YgfZ/GcvT domain-containing protein [Capsulimonadaceae bacterium]
MNQSPLLPALIERYGEALACATYLDDTWKLPAFFAPRGERAVAIAREYEALTAPGGLAVADRSWRAVIEVTGRDRHTFLQGMVSNDVAALEPGHGCRAALLDSTGHIQADLVVLSGESGSLQLIVDPRAAAKVSETLDKYIITEKVALADISGRWAVLTIAGEQAPAALAELLDIEVPHEPYGSTGAVWNGSNLRIVRSGPRSPAAFDIWFPVEELWLGPLQLWDALAGAGAVPVGEEALEVLRVESADPAWGVDLVPSILLPEAEITEAVSYVKGCYVGQEILARIRSRGHTNRSLRGILFEPGDNAMQAGDPLYREVNGEHAQWEIGRISSVVVSPRFGDRPLALAFLRREHTVAGTSVICRYAHRGAQGVVLVPPFTD